MNKKQFIEELMKRLEIDEKSAYIINDILEDNFLIGKKNKDEIISELKEKLNIDDIKANEIYNCVAEIIKESIKEKIKNPFKGND